MKELDLEEFKFVLEKAEQHHFHMTRSLLKKLDERDQEIMRLRNLLTENDIDPFDLTRQMNMDLAAISDKFKKFDESLAKMEIDRSSW